MRTEGRELVSCSKRASFVQRSEAEFPPSPAHAFPVMPKSRPRIAHVLMSMVSPRHHFSPGPIVPARHRHDIYAHCAAAPPQSRRHGIWQHANPSSGRICSKRKATSSPPRTLRSIQQNLAAAARCSMPAASFRALQKHRGRSVRAEAPSSSIPAASRQQHTGNSV